MPLAVWRRSQVLQFLRHRLGQRGDGVGGEIEPQPSGLEKLRTKGNERERKGTGYFIIAFSLAGDLRDGLELVRRMTSERDGQAASWIAANARTAAETAALQADAAQALTRAQAGMAWAAGAAQGEIAAASAADGEMLNSLSALLQTDGKLVLAGAAAAKSVNQAMLEDLRCKLTQARADVTTARRAGEVGATILQACVSDALRARTAVLEECANDWIYEWRRLVANRVAQLDYWWGFDREQASWYAMIQRFERAMTEGSLAGVLNVMDHATYGLISPLHRYRNQVWKDIGLAGTGWETASNVAAWIGIEALYSAGMIKAWGLLSKTAHASGDAQGIIRSVANGKLTGYTWHGLNQAIGRDGGLGVSLTGDSGCGKESAAGNAAGRRCSQVRR